MSEEEAFRRAEALFEKSYKQKATRRFISYGRLEILGNHTDHQHGHCLVAACSLGIKGAVKEASDGFVSLASEGYGHFVFPISDLSVKESEKGSSIALTRGVLAGLKERGYRIGGFRAAINSDIFAGAGVSSSAAYELFIAEVMNVLYNGGQIPRLELAKVGQYAENVYFGKASGLLDQCGSSFGGIQFLDFSDFKAVKVEAMPYPKWDVRILLVNPGASHAGLSDLYSEMPNDMKYVAKTLFGKEVLEEVPMKEFYSKIFLENPLINERQRLRALHFFSEDARTLRCRDAFTKGNFDLVFEMERETQLSQMALLHNVMVPSQYAGSPLEAVNRANEVLHEGSARVMGGGLVGTTLNFVPAKEYEAFMATMVGYYGASKVVEVSIPEKGAHEIK
jgi:galactokinase